jgi:serine/threonine-protein kinase
VIDQGEKPIPERIGKYDVLSVLGRGGMGVVYHARNARIGMDVAIKTLTQNYSADLNLLQRFYEEAGQTAKLKHANIVVVYDFGDEDGQPYIVMEYLDGDPLDRLIRQREPLHLSTKLEIIAQVCTALDYAHKQKMVHRDVKPANVIVQHDGPVKLLDFGIAKTREERFDKNLTSVGMMVGTPSYIAPERWNQEPFDGRSDIFSAGVLLYQLLTWVLPFDEKYPEIIQQILQKTPAPLSSFLPAYPAQLDRIVERALAKSPGDRYPDAGEMAADLQAVASQLKMDRVAELLVDSRKAVESEDFLEARNVLDQVLRFDAQNTEAKKLVAFVEQRLNQEKMRLKAEQVRVSALDAIARRNWDLASSLVNEGLELDPANSELEKLRAQAEEGKRKKEQIDQLLNDARKARDLRNYDLASKLAGQAAELEPSDSKIMAVCKILEQEAAKERRSIQLRSLVVAVQGLIAAGNLSEAAEKLAEAESLDSSEPDILRLKDELNEAVQQAERRKLTSELEDKVAMALSLEQLRAVSEELEAALSAHPTEAKLIRLKMQLNPRLREHEDRQFIAEISTACKKLSPADAIAKIREGLVRLPGNPELLKLESTIATRLDREQKEQRRAEYLAKARSLLDDHLYIEATKTLQNCEKEGFSSEELTELLETARSEAAKRVSQDFIERNFLEAKSLLEDQDYEGVLRILRPALERVEDSSLRKLLDEATRKQAELEIHIDTLLVDVQRLFDMGFYDVVCAQIRAESPGVRQAKRIQQVFDSCLRRIDEEKAHLNGIGAIYARIGNPDVFKDLKKVFKTTANPGDLAGIDKKLEGRIVRAAGDAVRRCIEQVRLALANEDAELAERARNEAVEWLPAASDATQAEWSKVQAELAASRKILRFRRTQRR